MVTFAITCRNGFISYTNLTNYDESLKYPLLDILKLSQSENIVLAGETTTLLNMPKEVFAGNTFGWNLSSSDG